MIMKKIMYVAALFAAVAFASCSGNKTSDAAASDSAEDSTVVAGETLDAAQAAACADSLTTALEAELKKSTPDAAKVKELTEAIRTTTEKLQSQGDEEAVKSYTSKVKEYLTTNAEKIKSVDPQSVTVLDVVNAAANLPQSVKNAAQDGVDAVKADGEAAKAAGEAAKNAAASAGKAAVSAAENTAKAAASKAASDAKAKKDEAVKKANDKANEAVQKGAQKASDAISKGLGKALGN